MIVSIEHKRYKKMWITDRWQVSCDQVNLKIKKARFGLDEYEQAKLDAINRVVEENGGKWQNDNRWIR